MKPWTPQEIRRFYTQRIPKLNVKGAEWRGPCPVHGGTRDSFAVKPSTGQAYCHSECRRGWSMVELESCLAGIDTTQAAKEIAALVGRTVNGNGHAPNRSGRRIVETYSYVDEAGANLFEVVRYEPKDFRQRRLIDGKHVYSLGDVPRVLFRLPKVIEATEVLIVEGEKDVLSLEKLGFTATTCPMGAGKWRAEYAEYLTGKRVVVIPDIDEPGEKHAAEILRSVQPVALSAALVRLPSKDATEWIQSGGTAASLRILIDEAMANCAAASSQFRVEPDGVYFIDHDQTKKPLRLCSPLKLVARTCDRNGHNWGVLTEWSDDRGNRHRWAIPKEAMAGEGGEVEKMLLNRGLDIVPRPRERKLLMEYLSQRIARHLFSASKVGWSENSFVFPEYTITRKGADEVIFVGQLDSLYRVKGTADEWRENVARMCRGNSRLVFAVSCGFAGPLLKLGNFGSGGFHFVGPTSCGKSTALVVGGSVIGGGDQNGFVQQWHATKNGLEAMAVSYNDLTLFLDELSQFDPKEAAEAAYLLGNGAGKGRMSKMIAARSSLSWTLFYFSAGEITLAEHVATAGRKTKGGVEVRLLNIHADAGRGLGIFEEIHGASSSAEFSNLVRSAALRFYGAPIVAFLRHVVENQTVIGEECRKQVRQFVAKHTPNNAASEVGRAAQRFGIVAAAGELATKLGLTSWEDGESEQSAAKCFRAWLHERGSIRSSDDDEGVRTVRDFLMSNGMSSRFIPTRNVPEGAKRAPENMSTREALIREIAGYRNLSTNGKVESFFILPGVFKKEICSGLNYKAVAAALAARGLLKRNDTERWAYKTRIPALGSDVYSVFCVVAGILAQED